jgi:hypothetical protein
MSERLCSNRSDPTYERQEKLSLLTIVECDNVGPVLDKFKGFGYRRQWTEGAPLTTDAADSNLQRKTRSLSKINGRLCN